VPFSFLTVVKTEFAVHLGARDPSAAAALDPGAAAAALEKARNALDKAWNALTTTLGDLGVGGKISAGYGRFTLVEPLPAPGTKR
jgi:CRISPR/Cas system CMR subunit Cmr6 (Cas7 group RAMP superfamily)